MVSKNLEKEEEKQPLQQPSDEDKEELLDFRPAKKQRQE